MEYWTDEGLSTVASGVGTPLYTDGITKECSRLDYARVCVMLDYNSTLPKHLVVISPVLCDGKEDPKRVDVEYEWLPQRCKQCCSLGHIASACPDNMKKKIAPPITIFVKKHLQSEVRSEVEAGVSTTNPTLASVPNTTATAPSRPGSERTEDGHLGIDKTGPVIRGSMIRVASWNVRGLNGVDHQRAVEQLRIRLNFLHNWSWFEDYSGPAGRIWLAWLPLEVNVEILRVEPQLIHCRAFNKRTHTKCLISVLYGDYDLIPRRDLWGVLRTLSAGILENHGCTLTIDEANLLDAPVTQSDIKDAFFAIDEDSAPATFSVALNGSVHGFFKGSRGLRQGLNVNPAKSQIILSRAVQQERRQIVEYLGFQEGSLPVRYLGVPLTSSRLTIADCRPLINRIDTRLAGWNQHNLSYAGRVQLIKGNAKVAWDQICKPKEEGGLGIRSMLAMNQALMLKHLWRILQNDGTSIWVDWIQHYRLRNSTIWTFNGATGSWSWKKLKITTSVAKRCLLQACTARSVALAASTEADIAEIISQLPPTNPTTSDQIYWSNSAGKFTVQSAILLFNLLQCKFNGTVFFETLLVNFED
ncbi:UNVERIFIED_CONTAM: putative ribonuclease H protein [Sesamum calycinum]|uniref:Ribonuclease H protein n=1 Tax=Sesamum calycinum TaxID=2727403 RepID=A0AAW2JG18_9LAMI